MSSDVALTFFSKADFYAAAEIAEALQWIHDESVCYGRSPRTFTEFRQLRRIETRSGDQRAVGRKRGHSFPAAYQRFQEARALPACSLYVV
jgi:hypothetical protein